MKLFLDTADLDDIRELAAWGCFSGVTVNPVLLAKALPKYAERADEYGKLWRADSPYREHAQKVLGVVPDDWDVSFEVYYTDAESMAKQADALASWDRRVRVKIPLTEEGILAAKRTIATKLNLTVVKSAAQAAIGMALWDGVGPGVELPCSAWKDIIISMFCGRLHQAGQEWQRTLETICLTRAMHCAQVPILAASMKSPADIAAALSLGADIVTAPPEVYRDALDSPLVTQDVVAFNVPFEDGTLDVPDS
jgi:transaldolase